MKRQVISTAIAVGVLILVIGLLAACGGAAPQSEPTAAPPPSVAPTEPPSSLPTEPPVLEGDMVRGGLLYDEWWAVLAEEEGERPATDHPLWATQSTNTRSGPDTWRCKECHGWDYKGIDGDYGSGSHMTGFSGVFGDKDKPATELLAALQGSTNADHDFSDVMEEQDLVDLALFLAEGQIETGELVNDDKSAKGDAAAGQESFNEVCANCHGPNGNAINFGSLDDPELVGGLAADNPWEFIHKVRFGQPGWPMPSAITNEWTLEQVANVLAYAQGLTSEPAVSGGGLLYDQWWTVVGVEEPTEDHPLWASQSTNTRSGADTWRCKECHGWDYKGVEGAYGSGSHMTGFAGVLDAASMSTEDLTAWLDGSKNADHDFSAGLDEAHINAMVLFLAEETFDSAPFINDDKSVNGEPARGQVRFERTCSSCHGLDGKQMNFGSEEEPEYIGTLAADNPWEFMHKAAFGQPGTPMPSGIALDWSLEDLANVLSYAQTLPTE